jgi:hypothetical protein
MGRGKKPDPIEKRPDETFLQWRARLARAQETVRRQGEDIVTPERLAKGDMQPALSPDQARARTYRKRSTSSLTRLCARGVIDSEQLAAAQEIAIHCERVRSEVRMSSGTLSEQVDCSDSGKSYGAEHLHRVCMERAYTEWRSALRQPRGMVLDMVTEDHKLAAIAARYGRSWRRAIEILREALNVWPQYKREAFHGITQDDIDRINQRLNQKNAA